MLKFLAIIYIAIVVFKVLYNISAFYYVDSMSQEEAKQCNLEDSWKTLKEHEILVHIVSIVTALMWPIKLFGRIVQEDEEILNESTEVDN